MAKWSKEQQAVYHKEWRKKNKEKLQQYHQQWHENNKNYIENYLEQNKDRIREKSKEYRDKNKDRIKKLWNQWYKEHPERSPKRRFTESKNKAIKIRKLSWTLTLEEYTKLISEPCYYCNNELGDPVKRSCGLDRLDSNTGYEITNVVSCCMICNTIKNEHLTPEETKIAVNAVLQFRKININPEEKIV